MDENFLLQTETAQKLYHEHAAKMPIIDYHCHLIPQMVADDYKFKSLTEIWLGGDHYKWRAMRTNGVDERFCTGKATDWEKFEKWAETVPYTFRNPLYHWTHLELKTAFGINKILNPKTAREIYDECNEKLAQPEYSARGMMRRYHVETVCTTDDPIDSLEYHIKTRESGFEIKMLPTWRPDKAMAVEVPADFRAYVEKLSEVSGVTISSFDDMVVALRKRHDFFAEQGCRLSDHGIEEFYAEDFPRLDELRDEKAKIDKEKAGINSQITSLKNTNKDLAHRIDTLNTEIAKCDLAWKNLFANKTWDEIEAKSMDGRFIKKEEKAKQEEPAKEEKASAGKEPSKEELKQEKAPAAEKPTVEDIDKPVEPMWTDLQSEEEAKKEEAEQAAKENNEKALVKTSRWSKLWNAIKHPIQTIKAAREKAKSGEGKRIIKNGDAIKKDGEPEKTEAQSVDAFIAKLRQMSEKEAAKDAQNKDNKEQPDYSKYVARHARKVEAQKQRDDEGR